MDKLRGHCLCGACGFEHWGPHNWVAHCHCESCRRATASPMTSFIGHPDGAWNWTGETPSSYESSPGQRRGFCGKCGSPMYYVSDRYPGETHFHAALLEEPSGLRPTVAYHADEALPWAPPLCPPEA